MKELINSNSKKKLDLAVLNFQNTEIIIGVVRSLNGLNFVSTDQPLGAYQNEVSSLSECDKIR